jgi:hypothetical protein
MTAMNTPRAVLCLPRVGNVCIDQFLPDFLQDLPLVKNPHSRLNQALQLPFFAMKEVCGLRKPY